MRLFYKFFNDFLMAHMYTVKCAYGKDTRLCKGVILNVGNDLHLKSVYLSNTKLNFFLLMERYNEVYVMI